MNRAEFMRQLESLLQSIPVTEREEALQYYNDYFDDAGEESEQEVIEALGNPARVAENIRRDLLESGYGEAPPKRALASDRKVIEYGKTEAQSPFPQSHELPQPVLSAGQQERAGGGRDAGNAGAFTEAGTPGRAGAPERTGMPGWAIALIVVLLVIVGPMVLGVLAGIMGTLVGVAAVWFCTILGLGIAAIALFIVMVVLVVVGILSMFVDPISGIALVGGGLLCGGIGILLMMLTVAMAGIVTPAVFKGIAFLFRKLLGLKKR